VDSRRDMGCESTRIQKKYGSAPEITNTHKKTQIDGNTP